MRLAAFLLIVAAVVALHLCTGCATRLDPRDPEIWRPSSPASYPLPE